jgi:hypothetical protein
MGRNDSLQLRSQDDAAREMEDEVHVFGPGIVCDTERRGYAAPRNRSRLELMVDATEGFIPLWAPGTTLRWRFQERSLQLFLDPEAAKATVRDLLAEAVLAWGDAAPVRFTHGEDAWDFEIAMRDVDRCNVSGCVLASAFFPDGGQHELTIYPRLATQSKQEQVETLVHEIGHMFGLRHFFANISEQAWPAVIFGTHQRFTIMNYGPDSRLTDEDKADLTTLYQAAWSGQLNQINGTPIRLLRPFSANRFTPDSLVAVGGTILS